MAKKKIIVEHKRKDETETVVPPEPRVEIFLPDLRVFEVTTLRMDQDRPTVRKIAAHEVKVDGTVVTFQDYITFPELGRIVLQTRHMFSDVVEMHEVQTISEAPERTM